MYKRYLIRETLTGEIFIEKGGTLIAWASNIDDAKYQIDLLITDSGPGHMPASDHNPNDEEKV